MSDVVFTNVRILDGTGQNPYTGSVLVQGNRIRQVGRSAASIAPGGATLIDAAGATRHQPRNSCPACRTAPYPRRPPRTRGCRSARSPGPSPPGRSRLTAASPRPGAAAGGRRATGPARARGPCRPAGVGSPRMLPAWWSCPPRWARGQRSRRPCARSGSARPPPPYGRTAPRGPAPRQQTEVRRAQACGESRFPR